MIKTSDMSFKVWFSIQICLSIMRNVRSIKKKVLPFFIEEQIKFVYLFNKI